VQILSLKLSHIWTKDHFDRLLISQEITENLIILGVDSVFDSYPLQKIWLKMSFLLFLLPLTKFLNPQG